MLRRLEKPPSLEPLLEPPLKSRVPSGDCQKLPLCEVHATPEGVSQSLQSERKDGGYCLLWDLGGEQGSSPATDGASAKGRDKPGLSDPRLTLGS